MNYFSCTFARSSKLSSLCLSVLIISRKFMFVACSTQNYKWLATKQLSLLAVARTKARSKTPMGLKFSQNIGDPTRNHQGKRRNVPDNLNSSVFYISSDLSYVCAPSNFVNFVNVVNT